MCFERLELRAVRRVGGNPGVDGSALSGVALAAQVAGEHAGSYVRLVGHAVRAEAYAITGITRDMNPTLTTPLESPRRLHFHAAAGAPRLSFVRLERVNAHHTAVTDGHVLGLAIFEIEPWHAKAGVVEYPDRSSSSDVANRP